MPHQAEFELRAKEDARDQAMWEVVGGASGATSSIGLRLGDGVGLSVPQGATLGVGLDDWRLASATLPYSTADAIEWGDLNGDLYEPVHVAQTGAPKIPLPERGGPEFVQFLKDRRDGLTAFIPERDAEAKGLLPRGAKFHYLEGFGDVKFDYYEVEVKFGPNQTPEQFIQGVAGNPTKFLTDGAWKEYSDFRAWSGGNEPKIGRMLDINIWGPDNGSVMLTDYKLDGLNSKFRYAPVDMSGYRERQDTLGTPFGNTGEHVVSGAREWGFRMDESGRTFLYTTGVSKQLERYHDPLDRILRLVDAYTNAFGGTISRSGGIQNANWFGMMKSAERWFSAGGGSAGNGAYLNQSGEFRPPLTAPIPDGLRFNR